MKIKVFGNGLIPRGYGLAPITEPFEVDEQTFNTILNTAGLRIEIEDPNGKFIKVTPGTVKEVIRRFDNVIKVEEKVEDPQIKPVVPEEKYALKYDNITTESSVQSTVKLSYEPKSLIVPADLDNLPTEDTKEKTTEENNDSNTNSYKNNKKHKR